MSSRERSSSSNSSSLDHGDFVVVQRAEGDDTLEDRTPSDASSDGECRANDIDPGVANRTPTASVEFSNVQRVYPTDKDIRVRCSLVHPFKHSELDSIGIYRLGWSDPSEAIAIEYVQVVQRVEQFHTTLRSCFLPSNPTYDEYYQFCYICNDGKTVKGASQPFHLIRSIKGDRPSIMSQQQSMRPDYLTTTCNSLGTSMAVVVKNEKAETPEPCSKCAEINSFKNRLDAALQSKALAASELVTLQERFEHLNNVFQAQTANLLEKTQQCKSLEMEKLQQEKTLNDIVEDVANHRKEHENAKKDLAEVISHRDRMFVELTTMKDERDKLASDKDRLEKQVTKLSEEANEQLIQLSDRDNWISSMSNEMARLDELVKALREEKDELNVSVIAIKTQRDEFCNQLSEIELQRGAVTQQQQVEMLRNQLEAAIAEKDKNITDASALKEERDNMMKDNEGLQERVMVLSGELNDQMMLVSDRDNWIGSMSGEIMRLEELMKKLQEERDELKATVSELREQRDDYCNQLSLIQIDRVAVTNEKEHFQQQIDVLENQLNDTGEEIIAKSHSSEQSEELENELACVKIQEAKLADKLHEVRVMAQSMTDERRETLMETLEVIREEKFEQKAMIEQLTVQVQHFNSLKDYYLRRISADKKQLKSSLAENARLQHDNDCLRPVHSSGSKQDVADADALLRYLPSITQQLLNLSHSRPESQMVIDEMRDMIRFLLTAHDRMKKEITDLKTKYEPE